MSHSNAALRRQWRILLAIAAEPRTVGSLSRQLKASKASIQRDLDALAEVFNVREVSDPRHKQRRLYVAELKEFTCPSCCFARFARITDSSLSPSTSA